MNAFRAANLCYDSLLSMVYPQACAVCGGSVERRELGVACAKCWRQTRVFSSAQLVCWKCGLPSTGTVTDDRREDVRCRRCEEHAFTVARACAVYEGAMSASVLALKRKPDVSSKLITLLANTSARHPLDKATRIVPVPLHAEREKLRGFNQAERLASKLSARIALPHINRTLIRTSHTSRHRAGMDATDRKKSVSGAFHVVHPALIAGEKILLIDDVFTTGATVSACAQSLLNAGATDVFVLTLARPLPY